MKKFAGILTLSIFLCLGSAAGAQEKVKEIKKEVKKDAKKVGRKTAEVASKGKSKITDQVHKDKVGPNNEVVYIDNHSKYYWVDKKGKRHYITEGELKAKVDQ
jgi:hypothetical protein